MRLGEVAPRRARRGTASNTNTNSSYGKRREYYQRQVGGELGGAVVEGLGLPGVSFGFGSDAGKYRAVGR